MSATRAPATVDHYLTIGAEFDVKAGAFRQGNKMSCSMGINLNLMN